MAASAAGKNDKATDNFHYDIELTGGQATSGRVLVKVWSYSKSATVSTMIAGKNAVHGVLFKGVARDEEKRLPALNPIVKDPDALATHEDFFKLFFSDGGDYMKYVVFPSNGVPDPGNVIKMGKEYRIGLTVSVAKDELRRAMEAAGVVKRMDAGF